MSTQTNASGSPTSVGTKYVADSKGNDLQKAVTAEKAKIIARKNPSVGQYIGNLFGSAVNGAEATAGTINNAQRSLDAYTRNVIQTLFSVELYTSKTIDRSTKSITSSLSSLTFEVQHDIQGVKTNINSLLKPVSSATGATLGTLTSIARDPLGAPSILGHALTALIDKINPGFADKLEATYKKYKTDELRNLPGQIFGSIRTLAATADAILSLPFAIASDLYNGLLEIMSEISNLIDTLLASVMDLVFGPEGILDSIIPFAEIRDFLDAVGELAATVTSISQYFGGFPKVEKISMSIESYATSTESLFRDPTRTALGYLNQYVPEAAKVTQVMDMIRNPQDIVDDLIPKSVQEQFQKISKLPGLGFVGNMGYSFGGTLESLSQGVLTRTIRDFEQQAGVLSPLLNIAPKALPVNSQQDAAPQIDGSPANPNLPVTEDSTRVSLAPPPRILKEKESSTPTIASAFTTGQTPGQSLLDLGVA